MQSLQNLVSLQTEHVAGYFAAEGCLPASDRHTNQLSLAIVRAFKREHGQAWIGNVDRDGEERTEPPLVEYRSGLVCAGCDFVVPENDATLARLIVEREAAPYTGTMDDAKRLVRIFKRIDHLGGVTLHWT